MAGEDLLFSEPKPTTLRLFRIYVSGDEKISDQKLSKTYHDAFFPDMPTDIFEKIIFEGSPSNQNKEKINLELIQQGKSESTHISDWCKENGGQTEVILSDNTRCDCITDTHAVEFDLANKWTEAVGQAMHYARVSGKKPGIVLILQSEDDKKYLDRLNQEIKTYNLPIDVWSIQGNSM
ncbi:MAG: hypothetical protein JEZ06_23775 [Anaerolineaceae bacterium]|nr:hypothetical protein [Anaerolineaceae bacterium]